MVYRGEILFFATQMWVNSLKIYLEGHLFSTH